MPIEKHNTIKSALIHVFDRKKGYENQHALNDISFNVHKGEFFGIVGRNGSGKSTLLKMLAGIYVPNKGVIHVNGKLTPFIELGVGFSPELTGRENIFLNGALLGFNRKEMQHMYKDIVDFAELHKFMDQKLKNYSSGMQVRLAFSIAIRARSDILLLDEVLAVGDADFQRKCLRYFTLLKRDKKTVVFVSHDMDSVKKYCDRVILIDDGVIKSEGNPQKVVPEFMSKFIEKDDDLGSIEDKSERDALPLGISGAVSTDNAAVNVEKVWLEDNGGQKISKINDDIEEFTVNFIVSAKRDENDIVPGVIITNDLGDFIVAANSKWTESKTYNIKATKKYKFKFRIKNIFEQGNYKVSVNVVSGDFNTFFAWKNEACSLYVDKSFLTGGKVNPNSEIEVEEL